MIIIPIHDLVLFPEVNFYFRRDSYEQWNIERAQAGEEVLFLLLKEQKDVRNTSEEDYYPIGFVAEFLTQDSEGLVRMRVKERVNISDIENENGELSATASVRTYTDLLSAEEKRTRFIHLREEYSAFIQSFQWGIWVKNVIEHWESLEEMMCAASRYMSISWQGKYELMELDSEAERYDRIENMVREFIAQSKIVEEAQNAQQDEQNRRYREAAIRKQIEYLEEQLHEMNPDDLSETEVYAKKIAESGMNDIARKEAEKILNRMRQEGKEGHEYGIHQDYLEFVTGLSWKKEELPQIDLKKVEQILDEDHYGLSKVKKRIVEQMAVMALNQKSSGSILLFTGAPGTGKTSIGQSIARSLNRKYVRISLGGVRDEAEIRGHRRTYVGAMPGRIMEGIRRSGASNPVVVLDEVDKLARDFSGDPASALLEVLDPEQNSTFTDHYMNVPYDLSDVLFICTANSMDTIPEPLLNRMEVIPFAGYTASEKYQIAKKHLISNVMKESGISENQMKITDKALKKVIDEYTAEAGVRTLKKQIAALCRHAAVKLVRQETAKITVNQKNIPEYLGDPIIRHDCKNENAFPGVVTGLAWTSAGGEILFIETRKLPGSGKVQITGQLGDVMKESVQIAISLVKALYPEETKELQQQDLHIHVPAGAVPKDGPSAGITIVTALSSLMTGKTVRTDLAMTGEISLRGKVLPIGGLPEKLLAAVRAGITTVLIPDENTKDLKEIPEEIKKKLEIIPVKDISEVLQYAL